MLQGDDNCGRRWKTSNTNFYVRNTWHFERSDGTNDVRQQLCSSSIHRQCHSNSRWSASNYNCACSLSGSSICISGGERLTHIIAHESWKEKEPDSIENKTKRIEENKGSKERFEMEHLSAQMTSASTVQANLEKEAAAHSVAVNFQPISFGIVVNFKNAKHFIINISTDKNISTEDAELVLNNIDIKGQIRDALIPLVEAAGAKR